MIGHVPGACVTGDKGFRDGGLWQVADNLGLLGQAVIRSSSSFGSRKT
jgi:hypothetical protein